MPQEHLLLLCGECHTWRTVVTTYWAADLHERGLQRGRDQIAEALDRLERENLRRAVEALSAALRRDLICADDFAPAGALTSRRAARNPPRR